MYCNASGAITLQQRMRAAVFGKGCNEHTNPLPIDEKLIRHRIKNKISHLKSLLKNSKE
jgi:hypothetical protein